MNNNNKKQNQSFRIKKDLTFLTTILIFIKLPRKSTFSANITLIPLRTILTRKQKILINLNKLISQLFIMNMQFNLGISHTLRNTTFITKAYFLINYTILLT